MKNYIKISVCAIAFVVAGFGAIKAYDAYGYNNEPNYMSNASLLNAENVSAYGDGGWGKVCKFIAGLWQCIEELVDPEPEPEPKHYIISNRSCQLGRDSQGKPIKGNEQYCLEQSGTGPNQCTPGWVGPCL